MATRLSDGSIQMADGRILYANSIILAADLLEILPLVTPPPAWPFVSGGGGGGAGTPGARGADGAPGAAGSQGPQGPGIGNPGPQGSQGNVGPQGNQGLAGSGTQGNQGSAGPQGNQGNVGFGAQGFQGNQGLTGSGAQGNQGNQGFGAQGFQGNQGLTGSGTQGNQGNQGAAGGGGGGFGAQLQRLTLFQTPMGGGFVTFDAVGYNNGMDVSSLDRIRVLTAGDYLFNFVGGAGNGTGGGDSVSVITEIWVNGARITGRDDQRIVSAYGPNRAMIDFTLGPIPLVPTDYVQVRIIGGNGDATAGLSADPNYLAYFTVHS